MVLDAPGLYVTELKQLTQKTKEAYDVLHGGGTVKGLYEQLGRAQATLDKKGVADWAKKQATEEVARLSALIKEAEKTYGDLQNQKNALNLKIKREKKAAEAANKEKTVAKTVEREYDNAIKELSKTELGLEGYKGQDKYIEAYRKADEAFKAAVKAGITPKQAMPLPKIEIPAVTITGEQGTAGKDGEKVAEPTITEFLATITDPANKSILASVQQDLAKNFGYKGATDGSPDARVIDAIQTAYISREKLPETWRGADFRSFLSNPSIGGIGTSSGVGGAGGATGAWATISSPSQAKSVINQIFQSELGRDATAKELKNLTPELIKAQAANPNKKKIVNGVTQTITGLDVGQWITDKARALPEYAAKKASKSDTTRETILGAIRANGIPQVDSQVESWVKQVQNGGDIEAVKRNIRSLAKTGQPESIKKLIDEGNDLAAIYAPYKQLMAQSLGVNYDTIDLNDPTLRMAMGPDKEMSFYDFKKALRQDRRWKYSEEAHNEVRDMVDQVKRDFGFMG